VVVVGVVVVVVRVLDWLGTAREHEVSVRRGMRVTVDVVAVSVRCFGHAVEGSEPAGQIGHQSCIISVCESRASLACGMGSAKS
jgi:hypothetical protein